MHWSPRAVRVGLIGCFLIPALIISVSGVLQAQPRRPITQPPKLERIWSCGKCGRDIGTGAFPPGNCPFCGVRIINGRGPANPPNNADPVPPPVELQPGPVAPPGVNAVGIETEPDQPRAPREQRPSNWPVILAIVVILLLLAGGVGILGVGVYFFVIRKHAGKKKKRAARRKS